MNSELPREPGTFLAEQKPGMSALIAVAVFLAGGFIGMILAARLAGDSGVTAAVSVLALPAAFLLSLIVWQGFTILVALVRFLLGRGRPSGSSAAFEALARKSWLLVPAPVIFATFAGLVAGILGDSGFIYSVFVYALAGTLYGLGCHVLGRKGMLPLLED